MQTLDSALTEVDRQLALDRPEGARAIVRPREYGLSDADVPRLAEAIRARGYDVQEREGPDGPALRVTPRERGEAATKPTAPAPSEPTERIHLQGIGKMPARKGGDIKPGDILSWNHSQYGYEVVAVKPVSAQFVMLTERNRETGAVSSRKVGKDRLLAAESRDKVAAKYRAAASKPGLSEAVRQRLRQQADELEKAQADKQQ